MPPPPAGRWPPGGDTSDRPDFSDWRPSAEIGAFKPGQPDPGLPPYPGIQTPHLDRFASTAASFRAAYVQQAICAVSRTSLLTGRRPDGTQVWDLHSYWRDLGNNYTTIPAYFKGQGYEPRLLPAQLIRFLTYPSLLYGYIANLGSTNVAI